MDKDKLNEACDTAFLENYFPSATESPDPRWEMFADGFKQCANWLMQQPLADRLTEEETERIRKLYHTLWGKSVHKTQLEFADIFGTDLFIEK